MKIIRILVGMAMLAAFAIAAPTAQADHDDPAGTNWPNVDTTSGEHDPRPTEKDDDDPISVCNVTGTVDGGAYTPGGPDHSVAVTGAGAPVPGLNDRPSHSHFEFHSVVLACEQVPGTSGGFSGDVGVESSGGNDGHQPLLSEDDSSIQPAGPTKATEVSPGGGCPAAPPAPPDPPGADGEHDFNNSAPCPNFTTDPADPPATTLDANLHHGSVNHSAWSNQSGYDSSVATGACDMAGPVNKANITALTVGMGGGTARGWVKYDRLGNAVVAWGQFNCPAGVNGTGTKFNADLVLSPDLSIPPGGAGFFAINGAARVFDGAWLN